MKVLWFTLTPCGAAEKLGLSVHVGGWLVSLEKEMVKDESIDLHICFYWGEHLEPFTINRTTYHPVLQPGSKSKTGRLVNRILKRRNDNVEVSRLKAVVSSVKPDLIHIHGTESNFGLVQEFVTTPAVVSMQGIISPYLEKYFAGVPFVRAAIHEGLVPKILYRSTYFMYTDLQKAAAREQKILSLTSAVIGRTDWDRRVCKILTPESRYYVGNEILRSAFYTHSWDKHEFDDEIQLVTIMSGALYKGLETIVKTAKLLKQSSTRKFKWTVIGQKESDDVPRIVKGWQRVTDLTTLGIYLVGSKSEVEVVEIFQSSDIFCQVSHIENSPNSLCEAMLLGMPIIASYAGGSDSIVRHKSEGTLVQSGDPYSLAGAITELGADFHAARAMGAAARATAHERHNKTNIATQLLTTYDQVLAQNKKESATRKRTAANIS